ncbi:MAG: FAD:protein FMN transferase [Candidatus Hadarchaeales archaeon]
MEAKGGVLHVAVAQLFATLSGFLFWVLLALLLHPFAYGEVAWKVSLAMLLSGVSLLGAGKASLALYPRKGEGILKGCLLLGLLPSVVAGTLLSLLLDPWTGLLLLSLSLFSLSFHFELSRRSYRRYLLLWVGARSLTLLLPFLLYLRLEEVRWLVLGLSLSYLPFSLPLLRTRGRELSLPPPTFLLGLWMADLGAASMNLLDKVVIGPLFGREELGMYQFGNRFFLLFASFPQILLFYLLPERAAGRRVGRTEKKALFCSFPLLLSALLLSLFLPSLFPGFGEGAKVLRVMALSLPLAVVAQIELSRLYSRQETSSVLLSYFSSLAVGLAGIVVLGKEFGVVGMASGFLLSQAVLSSSLFFLPRLGEESRKVAGASLGMAALTALLLSSLTVQPLTIHLRGDRVVGEGLAMDTFVEIQVVDENTAKAKEAVRAAYREIKRVEGLMSAEDKRAEIYLLNHGGTSWVELSEETLFLLRSSLDYSELSGGAFDITVKPLVDLWMKEVKEKGKLPSGERLSEVLARVGWEKLEVENGRARFSQEGMGVTLGGIAKGYAVDRACQVLREAGVGAGLVNVGGEIRGFGKVWTIGVQHPRKEEVMLVLELENFSIATSGDYRRFFLLGSQRVHHILDPRTGKPAGECMSVTVIASNCTDADALSTTLFVLGPEKGKELADNLSSSGRTVKAMLVGSDGRILYSDSWDLPRIEKLT